VLVDGPQQGLAELKLLERRPDPIAVPAAMLNLKIVLQPTVDGIHTEHCSRERQRFSVNLIKDIGEGVYLIAARKERHRPAVSKKWA
jgi:hypothetical protein